MACMTRNHPLAKLCDTLREKAKANCVGSATNAELAGLVSKVLKDDQSLFDTMTAHSFILGDHANQFCTEMDASGMVALADDLERTPAYRLFAASDDSVDRPSEMKDALSPCAAPGGGQAHRERRYEPVAIECKAEGHQQTERAGSLSLSGTSCPVEMSGEEERLVVPRAAVGVAALEAVRAAKVLVVGAGGIGCELLKNLVLSGYTNIEVIDLDTIDISNLNRQFLFRKKDVGKPKSQVAAEAVRQFNPHCQITHYCDNVKKPQYGVPFVSRFDIVLNALDNLSARRHVNRLCLAAGKPLVESGTKGYCGQVSVHLPRETECFECLPKPAEEKQYPMCTLSMTPNKPIHLVVWAKMVYEAFFGVQVPDMDLNYLSEGSKNTGYQALKVTAAAAEDGGQGDGRGLSDSRVAWARKVFHRCFYSEPKRLLSMDSLWVDEDGREKRRKPVAIDVDSSLGVEQLEMFAELDEIDDQQQMTRRQASLMFLKAAALLCGSENRTFNKDDPTACEFVIAACNLRSECFHMDALTPFKVREMAGNIIPAIASTNAIVGAMIVLEATKVLSSRSTAATQCRYTNLVRYPAGRRSNALLTSQPLGKPNSKCFVCSTASISVSLDTQVCSLDFLVNKVLCAKLGFHQPNVSFGTKELCGADPDDFGGAAQMEKNMQKLLSAWGIGHGAMLDVDDELTNLQRRVCIEHAEFDEEENPDGFAFTSGGAPAPVVEATAGGGTKRLAPSEVEARADADAEENGAKRARVV